ncbi:unnamed protein product [Anisakis simplex]|uniref:PH domain-containing protein n=1 Tax=Anisakis simplex TaxID=6269 RepID=A0A0M3IYD3_ANISI|nr:unnamed protein product [Anisakis simplex]
MLSESEVMNDDILVDELSLDQKLVMNRGNDKTAAKSLPSRSNSTAKIGIRLANLFEENISLVPKLRKGVPDRSKSSPQIDTASSSSTFSSTTSECLLYSALANVSLCEVEQGSNSPDGIVSKGTLGIAMVHRISPATTPQAAHSLSCKLGSKQSLYVISEGEGDRTAALSDSVLFDLAEYAENKSGRIVETRKAIGLKIKLTKKSLEANQWQNALIGMRCGGIRVFASPQFTCCVLLKKLKSVKEKNQATRETSGSPSGINTASTDLKNGANNSSTAASDAENKRDTDRSDHETLHEGSSKLGRESSTVYDSGMGMDKFYQTFLLEMDRLHHRLEMSSTRIVRDEIQPLKDEVSEIRKEMQKNKAEVKLTLDKIEKAVTEMSKKASTKKRSSQERSLLPSLIDRFKGDGHMELADVRSIITKTFSTTLMINDNVKDKSNS